MRELRFRAWDKESKEIISWELILLNNWDFKDYLVGDYKNRYIFMQYTNLKDKNGKEIYEGDIIQIKSRINGKILLIGTIKWGTKGFYLTGGASFWERFPDDRTEVIGNIYEHSHLLKEAK